MNVPPTQGGMWRRIQKIWVVTLGRLLIPQDGRLHVLYRTGYRLYLLATSSLGRLDGDKTPSKWTWKGRVPFDNSQTLIPTLTWSERWQRNWECCHVVRNMNGWPRLEAAWVLTTTGWLGVGAAASWTVQLQIDVANFKFNTHTFLKTEWSYQYYTKWQWTQSSSIMLHHSEIEADTKQLTANGWVQFSSCIVVYSSTWAWDEVITVWSDIELGKVHSQFIIIWKSKQTWNS